MFTESGEIIDLEEFRNVVDNPAAFISNADIFRSSAAFWIRYQIKEKYFFRIRAFCRGCVVHKIL